MKQNTARTNPIARLGAALLLVVFNLTAAYAATPSGTSVYPALSNIQTIELIGGSAGSARWTAPKAGTYQLWVQIPATSSTTNATYTVYPKGNAVGNTTCSSTDPAYPCFQIVVDQAIAINGWVQLMIGNNAATNWVFKKTGYVTTNASGIPNTQQLGVGEVVFASYTPPVFTIGQNYQGGKIFYIDKTKQHGLIAAPSDQSSGIPWDNGSYPNDPVTGATGTAIGTGQANTAAIITAQGAGSYAASLCDNLNLDGYTDWYLPSKGELIQLYLHKDVVGGFANNYYWSSSELNSSSAWFRYFGNVPLNSLHKSNMLAVRAVRAF